MDKKPPAPRKDEPHKPADADPAAAKASIDSLTQQLRAAPGQPRSSQSDEVLSTFDSVLVAVVVWALIALAVVYVAYRR